jgi:hypothetical protein
MDVEEIGNGLAALLGAQDVEVAATQFPAIEAHAAALVTLGQRLGDPVIWPIGAAAERIAGAATLISAGGVRLREWNTTVRGQRVLIFVVVALTPLSLFAGARQALNMGAVAVDACGLRVDGLEGAGLGPLANLHVVSGDFLAAPTAARRPLIVH